MRCYGGSSRPIAKRTWQHADISSSWNKLALASSIFFIRFTPRFIIKSLAILPIIELIGPSLVLPLCAQGPYLSFWSSNSSRKRGLRNHISYMSIRKHSTLTYRETVSDLETARLAIYYQSSHRTVVATYRSDCHRASNHYWTGLAYIRASGRKS